MRHPPDLIRFVRAQTGASLFARLGEQIEVGPFLRLTTGEREWSPEIRERMAQGCH